MPIDAEVLLVTRRFQVIRQAQQTPDGKIHWRETIQHPGAVTILPLVDEDHVCLIQNFRVAVGQSLWELPAGTLEPNEDPQVTARRELIEETGYRATTLERLSEFFMSPGILHERMHLFLATGLEAGSSALEPGEEITTRVFSWNEALEMAADGRIQDAKTLVGLLFYERFRRRR